MRKLSEPKTWNDFEATGLFAYVNLILRPFGWGLKAELDKETESTIISVTPFRTQNPLFSERFQENMNRKIKIYLTENPNYRQDEMDDRYGIKK